MKSKKNSKTNPKDEDLFEDDDDMLDDDDIDEEDIDDPKKLREKRRRQNKRKKLKEQGQKRYKIYSVLSFLLAVFFLMAWAGGAGLAGSKTYEYISMLFGYGYVMAPVIGIMLGISFMNLKRPNMAIAHTIASGALLLSSLALIEITLADKSGGLLGYYFLWPFKYLFGGTMTVIIYLAFIIISLIVLFDGVPFVGKLWEMFLAKLSEKKGTKDLPVFSEIKEEELNIKTMQTNTMPEPKPEPIVIKEEEINMIIPRSKNHKVYVPPPIDLLEHDKGKPETGDIKANSNIIRRTLLNFGIVVEMDEITVGPTVTRYALKPAEGVRLNKIVTLQQDLSLALAAHPLRIEAPIPGKSLVGIEIPNRVKSTVCLANLVSDPGFTENKKPLLVAIGRSISGKPVYANIAKMPHLLIAGTTGSGKSVTIHSIIASLLYRNGPEDMRFIFVDPKRVELTLYNKIPHLLTPVITDAKKTILSLKWAAKEMERRYDTLQEHMIQNIEQYHHKILPKLKTEKDENGFEKEPDRMPYIVFVIDELAEIMQLYPKELEAGIVRLAQLSRAVGIHLILSTQRPEVNIITGLIKANIPSRIALRVPTQIDSRTILDSAGAEKLLGAGDMLYNSGEGQPERLQSAYVTEEEVKSIVQYLKKQYEDELPETILTLDNMSNEKSIGGGSGFDDSEEDDRYEEAREIVIQSGKASTSYLQRKMGIGYSRAAKLIDILEEKGVVGPGNGSKPREVMERSVGEESQDYGI